MRRLFVSLCTVCLITLACRAGDPAEMLPAGAIASVQLNNLVNTTFGERRYHIDMAATILTSLVPLLVYFFSGRWFVRGIAAGAVKG